MTFRETPIAAAIREVVLPPSPEMMVLYWATALHRTAMSHRPLPSEMAEQRQQLLLAALALPNYLAG